MRLLPSDPDVETIIARIESKDLNLQPDFQRGEVWSRGKKQRLVDSILRDWHVPPIHVIESRETRRQEVLDGQQRLVAIRDFHRNEFPIDGTIEPKDPRISTLNGLRYRDLPADVRRQFNQFTIRVFRIVDYLSSEPAELFFRLNQPTNLTSAEQRNAYFGPVREQIREIAENLGPMGLDKNFLGFSNSRMAYDDVLSRAALCIERGTIAEKITSADLVERYRSEIALSQPTTDNLRLALKLLGAASQHNKEHPRFNKATFFSWILFVVRSNQHRLGAPIQPEELAKFLAYFEGHRLARSLGFEDETRSTVAGLSIDWLFAVYEDRATSRVADVSSVVLRDIVSWLLLFHFRSIERINGPAEISPQLIQIAKSTITGDPDGLARAALDHKWGDLL